MRSRQKPLSSSRRLHKANRTSGILPDPLVSERLDSSHLLDRLVPGTLQTFALLWHHCRREGSNPVPAQGPALVIANHPSHADPAFLIAASGRWIHFLQAREYHDVFLMQRLFDLWGCIPVKRGEPDLHAIREALRRLQQGAVVGVFPESDLSPSETGKLRPGRSGAALLALRSQAPVFPAYISGVSQTGSVVMGWLRPSPEVCVRFGPMIDLSGYARHRLTHRLLRDVTDLFVQRICELRTDDRPAAPAAATPVHRAAASA